MYTAYNRTTNKKFFPSDLNFKVCIRKGRVLFTHAILTRVVGCKNSVVSLVSACLFLREWFMTKTLTPQGEL